MLLLLAGMDPGMETNEIDAPAVAAILFDRDGTLIADVPYNSDPSLVRPMPTALEALARVRALGLPTGVVSNQSGIARRWLTWQEVRRVNARVEEMLGRFDVWRICPHAPDEGCVCRKPRPGMILAAAEALGVAPARIGVIGDIGADVEAARAAGARGILVPTPRTLRAEREAAPFVAGTLREAVELLVSPQPSAPEPRGRLGAAARARTGAAGAPV